MIDATFPSGARRLGRTILITFVLVVLAPMLANAPGWIAIAGGGHHDARGGWASSMPDRDR